MARDKDRTLNPAAQKLKSDKAKALAKSQKERLKQRQEKLARRNPDRIQRQIDDLKARQEGGRALPPHEKKMLEELERDVVAIRKAKTALGVVDEVKQERRDGSFGGDRGRGRGRGGRFGQGDGRQRFERRRDGEDSDSGDSTASSVADIPLPSGPPPIPQLQIGRKDTEPLPAHLTGLPAKPGTGAIAPHQPVVTTYSSAPVMRDLKKEAAVFMPAAVRQQRKVQDAIDKIKKDAEDLNIGDE